MSRKKKEEIILNLQMNFENGKVIFPYRTDEDRKVTNVIVQELEAFGVGTNGRIEGLGAHDDTVIALALANHATKTFTDTFIEIEDVGIFGSRPTVNLGGGIFGINY